MISTKPAMFAAITALTLIAMPVMAQTTPAVDPGGPAHAAKMQGNPTTVNGQPTVGANPNGPSNAVPGAAAKNALQNRGSGGGG